MAISCLLSNMEVCHIGGGVGIAFWGINRADVRRNRPETSLTLQGGYGDLHLAQP
jgi:hypothetical protein